MKRVISAVILLCMPVLLCFNCSAEKITSKDTIPAPDNAVSRKYEENITLVYEKYISLDVTVCDANGTPLPGAHLAVSVDGQDPQEGLTTDETGRIRLNQISSQCMYDISAEESSCGSSSASYKMAADTGEIDSIKISLPGVTKNSNGGSTQITEISGISYLPLIIAIAATLFFALDLVILFIAFIRGKLISKRGKYVK